ncbi:MAG: phosphoribosylformylglycinamidine synthase subunit PurQ [Clostridia bacterium]|nr:phosphoribosylformylglycinamidine synthase subunit PurQ [Clostridia bacterium]
MQEVYESKLTKVFPYYGEGEKVAKTTTSVKEWAKLAVLSNRPVAFIPAFPGTNCEIDTARALTRAGAEPRVLLINNLTSAAIGESLKEAVRMIGKSQMIVLPGGFSGGDEPDGSAKFITAFFRNPMMKDAVHELLKNRDGLMLGICNGFQALIKLGLVPYGEIIDVDDTCPTLTFNTIGRHQSMLVRTRIASNKSPWLQLVEAGDIHNIAISHGEGRFVASDAVVEELVRNGQVATQYVDLAGDPTMDLRFNPNGSVLGKMGHSERAGIDLYKNVQGNRFQPIFEGGVKYFK